MLCYYAAGCISGVTAFLISYPLDTIKIQQQFRGLRFTEAVRRIYKHRGWRGFYRGSLVALPINSLINTLFFGLCGDLRDYLVESRLQKAGLYWALSSKIYHAPYHPHHKSLLFIGSNEDNVRPEAATFTEDFISGALSGFALLGLSAPIELIKTKLQSQMKRKLFRGPVDCFKAIYKVSGVKGLYRGIVPMTIRNVAGAGVKLVFMCYVFNLCEQDLFPFSNYQTWLAVGVSGLASWIIALPFDTIKTQMQADDHKRPHYRGMAHVTKEIFRMDGLRGLYRGFWNVSARVVPLNCLTFVAYEYVERTRCTNQRNS